MINGLSTLRNCLSTLKSTYHATQTIQNIVTNIFTNQSVNQRINTFRQFTTQDLLTNQKLLHQSTDQILSGSQALTNQKNLQIKINHPVCLKFDSAKSLSTFIKQKSIKSNIRILHALAHIQYNAFTSYSHTYFTLSHQIQNQTKRKQFKKDLIKIALDQGEHFCMLNDRLQTLGWSYGSIPVIDQLYKAIQQTNSSLLQRVARISLLHEGKGMKAIKKLITQLQKQNDFDSIQILKVIEKQEVQHYQNGVKWFAYICKEQNYDIQQFCQKLSQRKQFRLLNIQDIKSTLSKIQKESS